MDWKISVLIYVITYSLSVILQKTLLKGDKSEVVSQSIFFQLSTGVILLLWSLVTNTFDLSFNWVEVWPNIALMTILYALGNIFIFKSLQKGSASSFSVYFSLRVFANLVLSSIFFGQSFPALGFVGLLAVLIGIVIVDYSSELWKISKSELYALLAAICIGVTNANSQFVLTEVNLSTFLVIAFIFPGLLLITIYPRKLKTLSNYMKKEYLGSFFSLAFIYTVSSIYFFKAIQDSADSALVTAVGLSSIIVTVIFAYIILKERDHFWRKLLAAVITFGGLLLLV
jgi:drug/metabolite transporter (DMT)-like permease